MTRMYGFKCQKCDELYEALCEFEEIESIEKEDKCECGGNIKRQWLFGRGIFKGEGFTRTSTDEVKIGKRDEEYRKAFPGN